MKDVRIGIRLDEETHEACKTLAPEGNISMWIRALIRKELANNKIPKGVMGLGGLDYEL